MAGIGFELRRVIGKGGLSRSLGAALAGVLVVAGPWLMTILSISLIRAAFSRGGFGFVPQFQVAVIYSYAFSLSLFSGFHHHFTRIVADLLWEGRKAEAAGWFLRFAAAAALLAAALAVPVMALLPLDLPRGEFAYRLACVLLFVSVNLMWIVMLFVSLLRRHLAILLVFGGGMAAAVLLVGLWSGGGGAAGAILGYAAGHFLTVGGLTALILADIRPRRPEGGMRFALGYAWKHRYLVLSGFLFYLGQWADKFAFWATRGESVPGTPFRLYEAYDLPVYLGGLSIIPGLVYFVVWSETEIAAAIRRFLASLGRDSLARLRQERERLGGELRRELRDQSLFQSLFSLGAALFLVAEGLQRGADWASIAVRLVAVAGAFFLFTLMTLLDFLYYFELFAEALIVSACFCALNGLVFPLLALLLPSLPPGAGFLAAAAIAAALGWGFLAAAIPRLDRLIFRRSLARD
jgi:uncharacterized membrane protein